MSSVNEKSERTTEASAGAVADLKLEVVVIPVPDVDRAKRFYVRLGWRLDADVAAGETFRIVQLTPPGSGCSIQEVTARLPGRVDTAETSYGSAGDLAQALRRAAAAHGEPEQRTGQADAHWPDWYAEYMVREQAGAELPS